MGKCCNCCTNTYKIGCIDPCGIQWDFSVKTPVGLAGEWALVIEFNRRNKRYTNNFAEAQKIVFAVGCINPYYNYKAWVEKPDGTVAKFTIDGNIYDCFEFETKLESKEGIDVNSTLVS